jgi:hypothetical protein
MGLAIIAATGSTAAVWGQWGWGGGYHSSTALEGAYRGLGSMVQSIGQANLLQAQADQINSQTATAQMQAQMQASEFYRQRRAENRAARQAQQRQNRASESAFWRRSTGVPGRMSPSELDPVTGQIDWPELLRASEFSRDRDIVDEVFRRRAEQGDTGQSMFMDVFNHANAMRGELVRRKDQVDADQFSTSSAFLRSLIAESQLPPT